MKLKTGILIFAMLMAILIPIGSASPYITPDEITETSIVWNLTQLPPGTMISTIAFDGIAVTGYDPSATRIVQNNLYSNESHIITITDTLANVYESSAYTLPSAQTRMIDQWNMWSYLIFIIALVFLGMIRKLGFLEVVASCVSLYALALYIQENPVMATLDIWHIQFILYIFFFVFPYVLLYFKGGLLK
jgi:hypothetical protein